MFPQYGARSCVYRLSLDSRPYSANTRELSFQNR
jgi:hypothetical protein